MMQVPASSHGRPAAPLRARRGGYTVLEILVAASILAMALSMTLGVFLTALKRAKHTEDMLDGTKELRYATDVISQAVRSSARLGTVATSPTYGNTTYAGAILYIAPKNRPKFIVNDITWLDAAKTVKGTKSNQKNMKVDYAGPAAVVTNAFSSGARPAAGIALNHAADYFTVAPSGGTTTQVSDVLHVNDTVNLPATNYGAAVDGLVVNSVSKNSGTATITFTNNVGVDVPSGTIIDGGIRSKFEVVVTSLVAGVPVATELRYYPDAAKTTYDVLAHNVAIAPYSNPSNTTSTKGPVFAIDANDASQVILNLQRLPAGTRVGRTLQGVQTSIFTRTNPNAP